MTAGRPREANEEVLREAIVVPEGTQSIAVSLDGVLAPVDGGNSPTEVRNAAAAEGRALRRWASAPSWGDGGWCKGEGDRGR